ncbi:unnamed protein product [Chondrus crispus]|uniref:Uncharacterized protein n=1 Tax=Chondrus crispus TaxID=2769 RepID=R7QHS7_CHOCR|nr:unnamed protein product [Chondrus crispus]CDF37634.1 unnamed protein product [Chondrus crispus]|eukprot:XP_005717505.1 unnamed protein product [Chondrus crispus]
MNKVADFTAPLVLTVACGPIFILISATKEETQCELELPPVPYPSASPFGPLLQSAGPHSLYTTNSRLAALTPFYKTNLRPPHFLQPLPPTESCLPSPSALLGSPAAAASPPSSKR